MSDSTITMFIESIRLRIQLYSIKYTLLRE